MTLFRENSDIDIEICGLLREHLPTVAEIESECFSEPWSQKSLELLLTENNFGIVAVCGTDVIGYGGMTTVLDEGAVTNIAVSKDFRKMGVGRRIVERMLLKAEQMGVSQVFLEVRESNAPAINLYTSLGFESCGIRKGFYKNPSENAIQMKKELIK